MPGHLRALPARAQPAHSRTDVTTEACHTVHLCLPAGQGSITKNGSVWLTRRPGGQSLITGPEGRSDHDCHAHLLSQAQAPPALSQALSTPGQNWLSSEAQLPSSICPAQEATPGATTWQPHASPRCWEDST